MLEVPRHDRAAPLRAVIPEWLTRPPEVEIYRREASLQREKADSEIDRAGRSRSFGALRAAILVAVSSVMMFEGFSLLPIAYAVTAGLALGLVIHRLDEGVLIWTVASMTMGCFLIPCIDGMLGRVLVPCMMAVLGNVAGVVRDPSFRL